MPGISSHEITRWAAFEHVEGPLDGRRIDYAAAQITQALAAQGLKKGKKLPKLEKFLITWGEKPKGSGLEMLYKVIMMNKMMGGKDERGTGLPEGDG